MDPIKRLCQLTLQDHNGYLKREDSEILAQVKEDMIKELSQLETSLVQLEERYKALVADKTAHNAERIMVYRQKSDLSENVDKLKRDIGNPDAVIRKSRSIYGKSQELIDSMAEQRAITDALWSCR